MRIATLRIYPVKGLRGFDVQTARVERCGLAGDRRWAIVAPNGKALTQRDLPAMARIDARCDGATLRLECAGHGGIDAHATETSAIIDVWRTLVPTRAANPEASAWLTRVLGTTCTLVHQADPASRPVTPDLARPGDVVSLADGFPLLITNQASLDDLNTRLQTPIPMDRFRPNLVVGGAPAWAEDTWSQIETPKIRLRLPSPCSRCTVTTLDQNTGENPARTEPLKTLATFHRDATGQITFGWNAIPETGGLVVIGENLCVRERLHDWSETREPAPIRSAGS